VVTLLWDQTTVIATTPDIITTDAAGYFAGLLRFQVVLRLVFHIITGKTSDNVSIDSSFTVTTGQLGFIENRWSITQYYASTGTTFDANSPVSFFWDNTPLSTASVMTDSIGGFEASITLPLSTPGSHTFKASTGEFGVAVADFTIDTSTLVIQPSSAKNNEDIVIQGTNFSVGKKVLITIDGLKMSFLDGDVMTDGGGNFSAKVRVPYTFASSVRVSAETGSNDIATIDLPITHSALFLAAQTGLQYGSIAGILVASALSLRFIYMMLFNAGKRAKFLEKMKSIRFSKEKVQ